MEINVSTYKAQTGCKVGGRTGTGHCERVREEVKTSPDSKLSWALNHESGFTEQRQEGKCYAQQSNTAKGSAQKSRAAPGWWGLEARIEGCICSFFHAKTF